jgi:hypothetical protein
VPPLTMTGGSLQGHDPVSNPSRSSQSRSTIVEFRLKKWQSYAHITWLPGLPLLFTQERSYCQDHGRIRRRTVPPQWQQTFKLLEFPSWTGNTANCSVYGWRIRSRTLHVSNPVNSCYALFCRKVNLFRRRASCYSAR